MLKNALLRKISVATCALIALLIICTFPTKDTTKYQVNQKYISTDNKKCDIFLIDENNYVAMTSIINNENDPISKARMLINALTIGTKANEYIPNGFKSIIPKNTEIKDISLDNELLKIDFNKNILNIDKENEEKMIEALVYSLTSIKGIKKIMIFVEGDILYKLPNSKKHLPQILDRSIGVNKIYDLNNYKDTTKTTIYYISKFKDSYYYVPVTKINNNHNNKVEIIINELKSTPIYQTNLMSYLKANAELQDYEIKEQTINLSFNENLFNDLENKKILEEVKYTISLSLKDTLNIEEVIFLVDHKEIDKMVFKPV